jgi:selenide,water dikinase
MGAKPLFAINLVGFPDGLDLNYLQEILRGGAEKVAEAGAVIAGGHSVTDQEPKYGLAVTGIVHPDSIKTKGGSNPGDFLVLTKPLGSGVVTTALKEQKAASDDVEAAVASMKILNSQAANAADKVGSKSMTDITGFGILGHAHEMAHLGHVDFEISLNNLTWLPGAVRYGEMGTFPGGMDNNLNYFKQWAEFDGVSKLMQLLLWTPETSGGLLVAVKPESVSTFQELCPKAVVVGKVLEGNGHIRVIG